MKMTEFELTVYNEDIDYSGIVYHPNYLKYMERARLNWFDSIGFGLEQQKNDGVYYVIPNIDLKFRRSARMGECLLIKTSVTVKGRAKAQLLFHQEIDNLTTKESLITQAEILVVCVNDSFKPRPLPTKILENIND